MQIGPNPIIIGGRGLGAMLPTLKMKQRTGARRCNASDATSSVVTCGPPSSPPPHHTRVGALRDLEPLQDRLTDEDIRYWTHGDDEEDEATVRAMIEAAEDPQEAMKRRLHCGGAYVEEILDD